MSEHKIPPKIVGAPGWKIYHKKKGRIPPYAYGNTEPALVRAARLKRVGIDLDLTLNRDGTPMVNHWRYPLFRDAWVDPAKKIPRRTPIDKMTDEQCARLRYRLNGKSYPMLTARQAAARCKSLGLIPCFEVKADPGRNRVYSVDFWREFKAMCDSVGVVPVIMSLPGSKGVPGRRKLKAALDAGLVTLWLWRKGYSIPSFVDLVKSHGGRNIYRVSDRPIGETPQPAPTPVPPAPPKPEPTEVPMATTANGHPVLFSNRTDGELPRLRKWIVPGTNRHLYARDGSMGFLLIHCALWFDETIERLDIKGQVWDEWGWAVRPVRGQTTGYSNHSGGVAVDLNATRHPRGVPVTRTMTAGQISRIKSRMRWYGGVIIWGGGWRTPDGMHFEIARISMRRAETVAKVMMRTKRGKRILEANPGARKVIES